MNNEYDRHMERAGETQEQITEFSWLKNIVQKVVSMALGTLLIGMFTYMYHVGDTVGHNTSRLDAALAPIQGEPVRDVVIRLANTQHRLVQRCEATRKVVRLLSSSYSKDKEKLLDRIRNLQSKCDKVEWGMNHAN